MMCHSTWLSNAHSTSECDLQMYQLSSACDQVPQTVSIIIKVNDFIFILYVFYVYSLPNRFHFCLTWTCNEGLTVNRRSLAWRSYEHTHKWRQSVSKEKWQKVYPNTELFKSNYHSSKWYMLPYTVTHEIQLQNFMYHIMHRPRVIPCQVGLYFKQLRP